jgi:hypothetical protein
MLPRLRPPRAGDDFSDLVTDAPAPTISYDSNFNTVLSPTEETDFKRWNIDLAARRTVKGDDYDLRRSARSRACRPAANGHWPDTFKKPNHPTFSCRSRRTRSSSTRPTRPASMGRRYVQADPESATRYADILHKQQDSLYGGKSEPDSSPDPYNYPGGEAVKGFMSGLVGSNAKMTGDAADGFGELVGSSS